MSKGGSRENTGPKLAIPAGEGTKIRTTVALGERVWDKLKAEWAGYSEQDIIRAVALEAVGEPVLALHHAQAKFTEAEARDYASLLVAFFDAGLELEEVGGASAPLGVRLELAFRQLSQRPEVAEAVGAERVTELLRAQHIARQRRLEDGKPYRQLRLT